MFIKKRKKLQLMNKLSSNRNKTIFYNSLNGVEYSVKKTGGIPATGQFIWC